jgi:hypothetical protein
MSTDQEANRIAAFVSFCGPVLSMAPSRMWPSNTMTPDMILSAVLSDTRVFCESNRDLYPPSTR